MVKILIQLKNNKLYFQIRKRLNNEQKNLINTNIISENELVFSDEYITQNIKLFHAFIKELINNNNLDTLVIKESLIAPLILHVTKNINAIKSLYLLEETILSYKICEKIIKNNSIKYVSLYNLPTYLLEMLDRENIIVDSRNEILFTSNFMKINNLETFSSLYYKKSIDLQFPLSDEDEEDFKTFININKYLKTIFVNKVNKNDIENILEILYKQKLKNIKIYIKDNINDIELIEYLKKLNKKNKKINNIKFKIYYSEEYLENNLFNQVHINAIKLCVFITLLFLSISIGSIFYSNYISSKKVEDIKNEINSTISQYKEENKKIENEEVKTNENELYNDENKEIETNKKEVINKELESLKTINKDTVGWLKVNNTNIDYPVLQHSDNDYYLSHNFKNIKDKAGWIYLDYRADSINLSDNNIIFGHNMYYSGVMFGTLYKAKSSSWYTNPENQIIEFNTLYDNMKWKIFSIYVIDKTNDYLIANFSTAEKFQEFLTLITNRSKYEFNTPVSTDDKILTLSTCSNNGTKRLVIHAVLLSDN